MGGIAYLIGAGPGSPDLITVRGMRALGRADVVLFDRLVPDALVSEAPGGAERIFVGKAPGCHGKTQPEINDLLVRLVRQGRTVARLKGGDPYVFGRGGEEALALARAGLAFEVIPSVSAAVAVPALAGVPVTHRGLSNGFVVVTGHPSERPGAAEPDWAAVARIPTIVVLMGLTRIDRICRELVRCGRAPHTPAVAIHRGSWPQERRVRATLESLPRAVAEAGIRPPAVVVIGETVALADELAPRPPRDAGPRSAL